jgi:hypothetical protein
MDTREGRNTRQSCQDLSLSLSLSPTPPPTPNQHRATAQKELHDPTCKLPAPFTSPFSLSHSLTPTESAQLETRRRPQARGCPETPSSTPNGQPPPSPSVDPAPAHALPVPMHALDAENGTRVLRYAHVLSPRAAHHPAHHRACNAVRTLPCTRKPQRAMPTT